MGILGLREKIRYVKKSGAKILYNMYKRGPGTQQALISYKRRPSLILLFSETRGLKYLFLKTLLIPSTKEKSAEN